MELKDIVSVTGVAGLHKVIGRNKTGLIVETIGENGKKFATNLRQRVSFLSDIAVFTENGETKLWEVIKSIRSMEDAGTAIPTGKSENDEVKAAMASILPGYDKEKVYVSDMKKLFTWYHTLRPVLNFETLGSEEESEETGEAEATAEKSKSKSTKTTKEKTTAKAPKTSAPKPTAGAKTKTTTPRKMGS